jgi:hypothetical protein
MFPGTAAVAPLLCGCSYVSEITAVCVDRDHRQRAL